MKRVCVPVGDRQVRTKAKNECPLDVQARDGQPMRPLCQDPASQPNVEPAQERAYGERPVPILPKRMPVFCVRG